MKQQRPAARDVRPSQDGRLGVDLGGPPSAYSLAQRSAEVKGLTLHPDAALERMRELQRHAGEFVDREHDLADRHRATRVRSLLITTVALWGAVLVTLLARL